MRPGLLLLRHRLIAPFGRQLKAFSAHGSDAIKPCGSSRLASSAGSNQPLKTLHKSRCGPRKEDSQKANQLFFLTFAGKRNQQRQWQLLFGDRRSKQASSRFPERASNKSVQPPFAPAFHGSPADSHEFPQLRHSFWSSAMTHCGNQNHDGAHKNLPTQKAERRWSVTPATSVACTAEAVTPITAILNIGGVAPGLTRIDGAVQTTAAGTPGFPALHRKVFVECQKEFV